MAKSGRHDQFSAVSSRTYPLGPLAERRALGYPYACNYQPFVVTGGGFLAPRTEPWPDDVSWRKSLEGRYASLAIGSNRSTNQLARKYIGWPEPLAIPAWPVRAIGLDVHFAAAIGHYGAIPATPVRAAGTSCDLMLVWLTPSERVRMDETEALGHAYDRYTLPVDCTDLPVAVSEVDVYVHRAGTYPLTGRQSVAMKELPVNGALDAHAGRLTQRMMQERLRRRYAPSISLQQFVGGNIHNAQLRRSRAALMGQRAVPAWSPKLTDGAAHHDDMAGVLGGCTGTAGGQFPRVRLVSMA